MLFAAFAVATAGWLGGLGLAQAAPPPPTSVAPETCALVEGLPARDAPILKTRPYRAGLAAVLRARGDRRQQARAHRKLDAALGKLMTEAREVFHRERGKSFDKARAQRFLKRYVYGKRPALKIGRLAFEPPDAVRATLAYSACTAGDVAAAVRLSRADGAKPSMAAYAALLLLELGRRDEATELLERLGDEGFLAAYVAAELGPDPTRRRVAHERAATRATTDSQRRALAAQAERLP